MIDEEFLSALRTITEKLSDTTLKWAIISSTNLALQGIDVVPHDIDVAVYDTDLPKIKEIFTDYEASEVESVPSKIGRPWQRVRLKIAGVLIEFVGESKDGIYGSKLTAGLIIKVNLAEIELPCLALDAEQKAYVELNRPEKAAMIKSFLTKIHHGR